MTPDEVAALISYIGVVLQLVASLLLGGLFWMLHRYARRGTYFTLWGWGWAALSFALLMVVVRLGVVAVAAPDLDERSAPARLLYGGYQGGKLLFFALLVTGALLYARGLSLRPRRVVLRVAAPVAVYATLSVLLSPGLDAVVAFQAPAAVAAFGYCAVALLGLPPSRSSFGSRRTGILFGTVAAVWVLYGAGFLLAAFQLPIPDFLGLLLRFNSYLDLLLQMVLGFGMVVMLMEDAKREADDARDRLALVHDRLKREAYTDVLTGTLNRRAFAEGVGLHLARAKFGSVVVVDLDNLKEVNDAHGHAAGDALLRHMSAALHVRLRASDALYRWGGDEFLLVLPGASPEQARRVVATAIAASKALDLGRGCAVRLAASAGAAGYAGGEDLRAALERADLEMYREKTFRKRAEAAPAAVA